MSEFSIPYIPTDFSKKRENNEPHPVRDSLIAIALLGSITWACTEAYKAAHPLVRYDVSNMPEYTQPVERTSYLDFENNDFINIRKVEFNNGEPTVPLTPSGKDTSGVVKYINKDEAKDYMILWTKPFKADGPGLIPGELDKAYVLIGKIEKQSNDSSLFFSIGAVNYSVLNKEGQAKVEETFTKKYKDNDTANNSTKNL